MNQILESQQTPHTSPSRASYGVSIVRILEKIDRVITAPHCIEIWSEWQTIFSIAFPLTRLPQCRIYASVIWISIGSDNGLAPNRRQTIIWANAGLLSISNLGRNFSEILIKIQIFPITKMHLKISSVKWRPSYPGREELIDESCRILIRISLKFVPKRPIAINLQFR